MTSCANCGSGLPGSARFCPTCGAPQDLGRLVAAPSSAPLPRQQSAWEVCEIRWWHGSIASEFYALAFDPLRGEYVAARSPSFWWTRSQAPSTPGERLRVAHEVLVKELEAAGWEPFDQAAPWYARRFRRRALSLDALAVQDVSEVEGTPSENGAAAKPSRTKEPRDQPPAKA